MAFREVSVTVIREVLRLWLRGEGLRSIERLVSLDRKTVRRYVQAAQAAGLVRDGGESQLSDELLGAVVEAVRPARPRGRGQAWERCAAERARIKGWLDDDVPVVKIVDLLSRRGVTVPERTLHRFCAEELGHRRNNTTVRVADGEPGGELQVDFGRLGYLVDAQGRRRLLRALIFTAVFSRHMFVWVTHRETLEDVIAGCEAAWTFFGGVFAVMIPDNLSPVVARADATAPRFTDAFTEYAQSRGFVIDPARVRHPQDKPRVERAVTYVRGSFFAGETFRDRDDAQRHAERWCLEVAGRRIHGTTRARPVEVFRLEEAPLLPAPTEPYDLPVYRTAKVHRDHHIEVARALYSVPGALIGQHVDVRADSQLVRVSHRGQVVKVHPRMPAGHRSTDADDLPADKAVYAMRDLDKLQAKATRHGEHIGAYAAALLEVPLPWTRMRAVYRLLGLVGKWGADRVDDACRRALDAEAVNVGLIARMLERATEGDTDTQPPPAAGNVIAGRFARDPAEFAVDRGEVAT
ncbi:MAG: IS21 family transposase [Nitriliruptorales bacterium]|nr:IS21 family transposase [Nitriliruptorales bacterium]